MKSPGARLFTRGRQFFFLLLAVPAPVMSLSCDPVLDPRGENERAAQSALMTLRQAEDELFESDRDQNGVKDYWTGDIAGLHALGLIPREIAEADTAAITPLVDPPKPHHGYLLVALEHDDDAGETPEAFKEDTDGKAGNVHHRGKFGWCAYPATYGETTRHTYLYAIGTRWGGLLKSDTAGQPVVRWPSPKERAERWSTVE